MYTTEIRKKKTQWLSRVAFQLRCWRDTLSTKPSMASFGRSTETGDVYDFGGKPHTLFLFIWLLNHSCFKCLVSRLSEEKPNTNKQKGNIIIVNMKAYDTIVIPHHCPWESKEEEEKEREIDKEWKIDRDREEGQNNKEREEVRES